VLDIDAEAVAPALSGAMAGLSGDKVEALLKKLLTAYGNVSVELEGENEAQRFTDDLADEAFCGEVQGMFILAFEVIKANFGNFFSNMSGSFGPVIANLLKTQSTTASTEN